MYHVGLVLRENGCMEVYSDFIKVSDYHNALHPCVDIETTTNNFFIKCVDNAVLAKMSEVDVEKHKNIFIYLKINHSWRNRIDISTAKEFFDDKKWDRILDYRIASYCKLFTRHSNFSTFMLVAHRNFISVYDMRTNEWK